MPLQFSVVIPTFNRKESLFRCLRSLASQTTSPAEFEVIVVDDGSTDGTKSAVECIQWPFPLICLRQDNSGPSAARNFGVTKARGEVIAFSEDDVEPRPDWLQNARAYFADSSMVLVEGRTVYSQTDDGVRRFEGGDRHSFIPCNLFVRKEAFTRVGGYDPSFYDVRTGLYFREDADLGFRILDMGVETRLASDVIVEHPRQFTSLAACFRHVRRYMFDPLLYRKHPVHFRRMIEVKSIAGITIHRPQHYLALVYALLVIAIFASLGQGFVQASLMLALFVFVCSFLFRYKYQGVKALRLYRLDETLAFLVLPLLYVGSFFKGCFRFKSFGLIL